MLTFKEFLLEDKQGKNLHLEHLEDEILNFGVGGGRGAINFLQSLRAVSYTHLTLPTITGV